MIFDYLVVKYILPAIILISYQHTTKYRTSYFVSTTDAFGDLDVTASGTTTYCNSSLFCLTTSIAPTISVNLINNVKFV